MLDLIKIDPADTQALTKRAENYMVMAKNLQDNLPMINEAVTHFGKTQSQFMDNFLTVSHPTPLRNARQILAEINKSIAALHEAQYNMNKKQLLIKRLERDLQTETDDLKIDEIKLEIAFESSNLSRSMLYVEGAIRAVTNYTEQYQQLMKAAGYEKMSEVDFEKEEEKYHIMKAFDQALCAARAHGGVIDEGNHIYFSQIGVNGAMAQNFITKYLQLEQEIIAKNGILTAKFQYDFLTDMANVFKGCSIKVAEIKGIAPETKLALLK